MNGETLVRAHPASFGFLRRPCYDENGLDAWEAPNGVIALYRRGEAPTAVRDPRIGPAVYPECEEIIVPDAVRGDDDNKPSLPGH